MQPMQPLAERHDETRARAQKTCCCYAAPLLYNNGDTIAAKGTGKIPLSLLTKPLTGKAHSLHRRLHAALLRRGHDRQFMPAAIGVALVGERPTTAHAIIRPRAHWARSRWLGRQLGAGTIGLACGRAAA